MTRRFVSGYLGRVPPPTTVMRLVRVNNRPDDGAQLLEFARSLDLPPEALAGFLKSTAELANLADTWTATQEPGTWLRIARQAAELIGG